MHAPSSGKHACTAHVPLSSMGAWVKVCNSSAQGGGREHGHWQHPCGALIHSSVHAKPCETCLCMASLHAVHPGTGACTCAHSLARWHHVCPRATFCAVLVPPGMCVQRCEVWVSLRACARPGSQCPVPRRSVPAMPPSCPHVECPQTAPGTAPPPASTNPLSPLSPTGCKLSCHTKCQAKVRPVP